MILLFYLIKNMYNCLKFEDVLVIRGVESVHDVKVLRPAAVQARSVASAVVEWCQDLQNTTNFCAFEKDLTAELSMCITSSSAAHSGPHVRREHMWHQYHSLRISGTFKRRWTEFIQTSTQQSADPSFYQHVSDVVFDELIKQNFPLQKKSNMSKDIAITNEEANVIRYAAGYTLRTVKKKVGTSAAHRLEGEIIACIMDLLAYLEGTEEEVAAEWVRAINRGGLWHIKSCTFFLFCAIEEKLRSYLKVSRMEKISDGAKMEIAGTIISNDDDAFYWSMLCIGAGDEEKDELLSRIVDLWVTIRGFSFARSWMEMFKQANRKHNVQKL